MKQKEITKTFMMIFNRKNLCSPWFKQKHISVVTVNAGSTNDCEAGPALKQHMINLS